ncbi:MAG: response regulator [Deltaproteobacteria bacterium]|nr:response regulator [Deltaproteobacteria bacterium]
MKQRVLIVDDAIFMRQKLNDIINSTHYEVCGFAENGIEGIEQYKKLKPDIVTMDIIMPEMDGIDAVKKIIAHDKNAKILMVSAMGQQQLVVEAIQAGAKDFIVKPFEPPSVVAAIDKVLG